MLRGFSSNTADSPGKQLHTELRKKSSLAVAALLMAEEKKSPNLEEVNKTMRDLCIKAHTHTLWIQWLSDELSTIVLRDLTSDDGSSATTPLHQTFFQWVIQAPVWRYNQRTQQTDQLSGESRKEAHGRIRRRLMVLYGFMRSKEGSCSIHSTNSALEEAVT